MSHVGVNVGALTVKVVALRADDRMRGSSPIRGARWKSSRTCSRRSSPTASTSACPATWATSPRSPPSSGPCASWTAISTPWLRWAASRFWSTSSPTAGSPTSCRTTNAPPAAASSSCSRSAGWDWRSRRRSGVRSTGKVVPLASPLLGPLQVGHHPQAQPQRGHARGHPAHAARQHGQQGGRPAGERPARAAAGCW